MSDMADIFIQGICQKCKMCTCAWTGIVHCSEFICGIYTDSCLIFAHELISICDIYIYTHTHTHYIICFF